MHYHKGGVCFGAGTVQQGIYVLDYNPHTPTHTHTDTHMHSTVQHQPSPKTAPTNTPTTVSAVRRAVQWDLQKNTVHPHSESPRRENPTQLYHRRLAHPSYQRLQTMARQKLVLGLPPVSQHQTQLQAPRVSPASRASSRGPHSHPPPQSTHNQGSSSMSISAGPSSLQPRGGSVTSWP